MDLYHHPHVCSGYGKVLADGEASVKTGDWLCILDADMGCEWFTAAMPAPWLKSLYPVHMNISSYSWLPCAASGHPHFFDSVLGLVVGEQDRTGEPIHYVLSPQVFSNVKLR
jgi:hypothetical protein